MPNLAAYNNTSIDWTRVRQYASRVARETPLPLERPWQYAVTGLASEIARPASRGFLGIGARSETRRMLATSGIVEVLPEHWVIDRRGWNRRETSRFSSTRVEENDSEDHVYALLSDGTLKVAVLTTNEVWNYRGGKAELVIAPTSSHVVNELNDYHASVLDFEKRYYDGSNSGRPTYSWGDRDPGKRLIRHAKGVGLNLELKRILDGRARV